MTINQLYNDCLLRLKNSGNDDYRFDCDCLFEHFIGFDKVKRITKGEFPVPDKACKELSDAVDRRTQGEPLQYILGKWSFMDCDFFVGSGVLIPRPETEMLVLRADEIIRENKLSTVFDLCAGTGAIGLSIARLNPDCRVYLFEKYDGAFFYLQKNIGAFGLENVTAVKCDITDFNASWLPKADLIVSNPPYIKKSEIKLLQKEVLKEPVTALSAGEDGLDFYRAIRSKWLSLLKNNGTVLLECGDGQSSDVIACFDGVIKSSAVYYDFNNIDRAVEINV